jgi:hypothetical protein
MGLGRAVPPRGRTRRGSMQAAQTTLPIMASHRPAETSPRTRRLQVPPETFPSAEADAPGLDRALRFLEHGRSERKILHFGEVSPELGEPSRRPKC